MKARANEGLRVAIKLDGKALEVSAGTTVAAALAQRKPGFSRRSVTGELRAPLCGMGICQECRLMIDGRRRLACQVVCRDGMSIQTETNRG